MSSPVFFKLLAIFVIHPVVLPVPIGRGCNALGLPLPTVVDEILQTLGQAVVMLSALPIGSNALIFAQRYRTLEAETTAATVFSTLAFVAVAPAWLVVPGWLG